MTIYEEEINKMIQSIHKINRFLKRRKLVKKKMNKIMRKKHQNHLFCQRSIIMKISKKENQNQIKY